MSDVQNTETSNIAPVETSTGGNTIILSLWIAVVVLTCFSIVKHIVMQRTTRAPKYFTVVANASEGVAVSPRTIVVPEGSAAVFRAETALGHTELKVISSGYTIAAVAGTGTALKPLRGTYTTKPITADTTITWYASKARKQEIR